MQLYLVAAAVVAAAAAAIGYVLSGNDSGGSTSPNPPPPSDTQSPTPPPPPPPSGAGGYWSGQRYTVKQKRLKDPVEPSESQNNNRANTSKIDDGARIVQTTKRHLWLLDLTVGDVVTNERLATELEIEPAVGWHQDRAIILAVLLEPGSFFLHKSGRRFRISESGYRPAALPPISGQAVPILSASDDGWRFEGFFRLGRPATYSVACNLIDGPPPELIDLMKRRNGTGC